MSSASQLLFGSTQGEDWAAPAPTPGNIFADYETKLLSYGARHFWPVLASDADTNILTDKFGGATLNAEQFGANPIVNLDYTATGLISGSSAVVLNEAKFGGSSLNLTAPTSSYTIVFYTIKPTIDTTQWFGFGNTFEGNRINFGPRLRTILNGGNIYNIDSTGIDTLEGTGNFFQVAYVQNGTTTTVFLNGTNRGSLTTETATLSTGNSIDLASLTGSTSPSVGNTINTTYCMWSFHEQALNGTQLSDLATEAGI